MPVVLLCLSLLAILPSSAQAGCSDEAFEESVQIYDAALKESSEDTKIELPERAFSTCQSHGHFARGYARLGRLYLNRGDSENAMKWLVLANRFRAVLLQQSLSDLSETNRLPTRIYRDRGNAERSLAHTSLYHAVSKIRGEKPCRDYITSVEAY
jgi:hypothetical protein